MLNAVICNRVIYHTTLFIMLLHHLLTTFLLLSLFSHRLSSSSFSCTFISCRVLLHVNSSLLLHISHLLSPSFALVHVPCAVIILFFWLFFFFLATLNLTLDPLTSLSAPLIVAQYSTLSTLLLFLISSTPITLISSVSLNPG